MDPVSKLGPKDNAEPDAKEIAEPSRLRRIKHFCGTYSSLRTSHFRMHYFPENLSIFTPSNLSLSPIP